MGTPDEIVMYIIARADLKMSPGKLAAQVGHGVQYAMMKARNGSEETLETLERWENGSSTKIVLKAESYSHLMALQSSIPITSVVVVDEGRTEIPSTETVLALVPVPKSFAAPYLNHLPLYR